MMNGPKVNTCALCGSTMVLVQVIEVGDSKRFAVQCGSCLFQTGSDHSAVVAVGIWNRMNNLYERLLEQMRANEITKGRNIDEVNGFN